MPQYYTHFIKSNTVEIQLTGLSETRASLNLDTLVLYSEVRIQLGPVGLRLNIVMQNTPAFRIRDEIDRRRPSRKKNNLLQIKK